MAEESERRERDLLGGLLHDFHADGAVPRDDPRVVKRVDHRPPRLLRHALTRSLGTVEVGPLEPNLCPEPLHRLPLHQMKEVHPSKLGGNHHRDFPTLW